MHAIRKTFMDQISRRHPSCFKKIWGFCRDGLLHAFVSYKYVVFWGYKAWSYKWVFWRTAYFFYNLFSSRCITLHAVDKVLEEVIRAAKIPQDTVQYFYEVLTGKVWSFLSLLLLCRLLCAHVLL